MTRIKYAVAALMIIAAVFLSPVSSVLADETEGTYSEDVPYMQGISVELIRFDLNPFNYIFAETNKQCHIKRLEFRYDRQTSIDYSDYEFVFDFILKSQLEDGAIIDTGYRYVIDGDSEEGSVSQLDEILIFFDLKDDYFSWSFDYEDLVFKSDLCEVKKDLLQQKAYNTVVSSVDCYIRSKSELCYGLKSHFDFIWYEDFYKQNCSQILYELVVPDVNEVIDSGSVENHKFAGSYDSDGNNLFYKISGAFYQFTEFLVDIPKVLYIIASNIFSLAIKLLKLLKVVFPFIPGLIFDVFAALVVFSFLIALWKLIKGE